MSFKISLRQILILVLTIVSYANGLKVKINGKQKDYCFIKSIYDVEDTIKIFF